MSNQRMEMNMEQQQEPKVGPNRFRISVHQNGYYQVSIPNYHGGEVIKAEAHDALIQALKPFAAMHRIGSDPAETACVRGMASDLTAITSGDFELAFNALRDAGALGEDEQREPQLIRA